MSDDRKAGSSPRRRHDGGHGPRIEKPENFGKSLRRMLAYLRGEQVFFFFGLVLIVAGVVLNTLAPAMLGNAITEHLEREPNLTLFVHEMLVLLAVYLGAFAANAASGVLLSFMTNRLIFKIRKEAFDHIQRLSVSFFDTSRSGDIISRMTNDIETIQNFLSSGLTQAANGLFTLVGILVAMLSLNAPLSGAVLLTTPFMAVAVVVIGKRMRKAALENQKQVGALTGAIEESVVGMKVIQSFHRQEEEFHRYDQINTRARQAGIRMETIGYLLMPVMFFMTALALAFVIGFGGIMAVRNPQVYSVGLITSFIVYARRFFQPIQRIAGVYNIFQTALAGAERVFSVLDSEDIISEPDDPVLVDDIEGHVEFSGVSFRYTPDKPVLEDISLTADPGEVVAVVGPTGAGKTTLINLLSRFYDVDAGAIKVDGTDIRRYAKKTLRDSMGVVLQEPFFFAATIRENLLFGRPGATEEELVEACTLSEAHHFITRLPEQYDTMLSERGMNLSQGERQLLAIARTILARPKILVLDEATSSVDSVTETHIQKGLTRLMRGKTSFIIAHRLSTIKNADKIVVLHNHRVIEEGNHESLMAAGGFYHRLYSLQFKKAEITEDMEI